MRKLNTILSVLLLFICLLHGLMGSFMLLGISSGAGKFLAWIGVGILAAHTVLGLLLTAQTFRASRSGGKLYGKQNALFWARRTSGLAILLMLFFHIGVFGRVQDGVYILFPFTTVRLLTQLLLVASVFVHLLLNTQRQALKHHSRTAFPSTNCATRIPPAITVLSPTTACWLPV